MTNSRPTGAQLAAMPDDRRRCALLRCPLSQLLDCGTARVREWSLWVYARRHSLTVVNEIQAHDSSSRAAGMVR